MNKARTPSIEVAPGVHWIGALDPTLRTFDIILKTANGTSYNSYVVRGENGVLKVPMWALIRQRSNPFHTYLVERIDGFVAGSAAP